MEIPQHIIDSLADSLSQPELIPFDDETEVVADYDDDFFSIRVAIRYDIAWHYCHELDPSDCWSSYPNVRPETLKVIKGEYYPSEDSDEYVSIKDDLYRQLEDSI